LKFIRARKFNPDRALSMLQNYNEWSLQIGLPYLNIKTVRALLESEVLLFPKALDKQGRTIMYMVPGRYFPNKTPVDELMRLLVYLLERAIDSEQTQKEGFTFVANMKDWGWSNFSTYYARTFFDTLQNRFPARVGLFLIVDPPSWFSLIWSLIRPMMSRKFAAKVNLPRSDMLEQWIERQYIHKELGGTLDYDHKMWIRNRYEVEGLSYTEDVENDSSSLPSMSAPAVVDPLKPIDQ